MPKAPAAVARRRFSFRTPALCAALLAIFASLALFSSRSKSPTYDEPLHALSAWITLHDRDFRLDPEDPPLWKYWAALPNGIDALHPSDKPELFDAVADDLYHEWEFTVDMLYRTNDNAARSDDFVQRSRAMMLALGVVLGVLIGWWGWQLGGKAGGATVALAATTLFALDPNFLAHSPLVKNDVPLALCATALIIAVWRAGRHLTVLNALAIALLSTAAINVKFSGLLLGPIVAVLLMARALGRTPWETFWRRIDSRGERVVIAIGVLILAMGISYVGTWACYFYRFGPSRNPDIVLNQKRMTVYASMSEMELKHPGTMPTTEEVDAWRPSPMTRAILMLDEMHFLPQAWLNGLYYTYQSALARKTFLLGNYSLTGWWYYFPLAMLFKTPLATLIAALGAVIIACIALRNRFKTPSGQPASAGRIDPDTTWTALCLIIPPAIFMLSAMRSNLNLGLRHVLPVYPFIFLGIALAAKEAIMRWGKPAKITLGVLAVALAAESLAAFPNFIPFFNVAAGGSRGGIKLLGDSNLDWGQDLKLLAQWQQDHPSTNLYLVYFGLADPWAYDIHYVNFPGGYGFGAKHEIRGEPGVLAISATQLQGIYLSSNGEDGLREDYAKLHDVQPIEVLGGSIYLYRWPLRK